MSSGRHQSLLLLSPAPAPPTYPNVKAAFNAPLQVVLTTLQRQASSARTARRSLDIALPCPHLYAAGDASRSSVYDLTQQLLATVYKLITVIAAAHSIDVETSDGLDVRVLLVSFPRDVQSTKTTPSGPGNDLVGPVVSIQTLAAAGRVWETVYAIETEQGEDVLKLFMTSGRASPSVQRVRGGITSLSGPAADLTASQGTEAPRHRSVALGGTFDHLHIGHKLLLTMSAFLLDLPEGDAADTRERVLTIGVTSGELLKNKKYAEHLESWDTRQASVWSYLAGTMLFTRPGSEAVRIETLNEEGPNGHAVHYHLPSGVVIRIVEIWDPFGPTITDDAISALVISAETRSGGQAVNNKRKDKGWSELDVFEVDVLDAEEEDDTRPKEVAQGFQNKLSSTEIRRLQSERSKLASKV